MSATRPAPEERWQAAPEQLPKRRWTQLLIAENGLRWTAYAAMHSALRKATRLVNDRMIRLERRHGLEGRTSVGVNYQLWQHWDWSRRGEEWTPSEEWKQSLIDDVMLAYLMPQTTTLEIGPGAGRWTEVLQRIAKRLIVVDLSDRCIELCRRRFAKAENMELHVNDGRSLPFIPDESVDGVWSFDVFVHIASRDIEAYVAEISRVLKRGGRAVIHHARAGRDDDAVNVGLRSTMTADLFAELVGAHGLKLVSQLDSWGPGGRFTFAVPTEWDIISVVEK
jgi:SAM-dependent methyltransferase